jgi:formate hydrogenlyase subunit 3/multisubunit Na+/H+ antiporter MnhD subunit
MLAYSSVSQMGYIILGLGIGSYLGFYGAIYHLLNHAIDKAMLFLCSGVLLYSFGTTDMDKLGAHKQSRLLAVCFFIGALGISGMPPLNGFWSKFAIYTAAAQAQLWWPLGIALFTSLLTLAVLIRAGARMFLQSGHAGEGEGEAHAHELVLQPAAVAVAAGVGCAGGLHTREQARVQFSAGTASSRDNDSATESSAHRCPKAMMAVIVLMTLLVVVTGLNLGVVTRLIDLSVRALLQQMGGG